VPFESPYSSDSPQLLDWKPWGREVFAQAAEDDTPVLLLLSTTWCRWCHLMDESTLIDPLVVRGIQQSFLPVRVDPEERPDINHRYSMGGWPTVAILTPEGELITGTTYAGPGEMVEMLSNASEIWREYRPQISEEVAELRLNAVALLDQMRSNPDAPPFEDDALATLLDTALLAFDEEYGGFGTGAKFPRPDILFALLALLRLPDRLTSRQARARQILERTVETIAGGGLHDTVEGGFFRYAAARDWTAPHTEKLLSDNAQLTHLLAQAGMELGRPDWICLAGDSLAFLDTSLLQTEQGLYASSHGARDDYYALTTRERRRTAQPPSLHPVTYSSPNAVAGRALVAVALATEDHLLLDRAIDLSDALWERRSERGLVQHAAVPSADCFLEAQIHLLALLLDLAEKDPEPDRSFAARERAGALWGDVDRYFSVSGRCVLLADTAAPADVPTKTLPFYEARLGRLSRTETPPRENALAAACLVRLARLNADDALLERATIMLRQLLPYVTHMGNFAIELAHTALVLRGA